MRIEKIVINASPFILLAKSGFIELLPQLFTEIRMPEAVSTEIINGGDSATDKLFDCEKIGLFVVPSTPPKKLKCGISATAKRKF
jgi:predicted nucleic acid-binding protein